MRSGIDFQNRTAFFRIPILLGAFFISSCEDDPSLPPPEMNPVHAKLKLDTLIGDLSKPWSFEFIDSGRILITDLSGSMLIWQNGETGWVENVPEFVQVGQGGLLDVRKHPAFSSNQLLYFCGSTGSASAFSTTLYRARLQGKRLTDIEKLFQAKPQNNSGAHFGSRIVFDGNGHVFLSLGERGDMQSAQQKSNHNGSVIRLMENGSIPPDNPFVSQAGSQPEIWTYGHRNVQGMAVHPQTGEIWTHEHGPKGGDEINILQKGSNYGWPLATFGVNYNGSEISKDTFVEGTILPVYYWVPSIAPCGMDFYFSDSIPQWKGSLFLGALAGRHLNRLSQNAKRITAEERLLRDVARFRSVRQGPDGGLYMLTEQPGMLLRYRPDN